MIGKILKELRLSKSLTQENLGSILNKTKNNISQYETNKREPDNKTLKKLSDYFNVSIDYLLGKSQIKNPYKNYQIKNSMQKIPQKFTDPVAARKYVSKHEIFVTNEFKPEKMTDEEILDFVNALQQQMKLLMYKYKK